MKKSITIVAIIIIVLGGAAGIYFYFFANSPQVVVNPNGSTPSFPVAPTASSTAPGAFSGGNASSSPTTSSSTPVVTQSTPLASTTAARLVEITKSPVVPGIAVFNENATGTTATSTLSEPQVRYIERQSGNVYDYNATTGVQTRISNKTIPGIEHAVWLSDGSLAYVRYLSTVSGETNLQTYALPANGKNGFFLAQDLSGLSTNASNAILTLASGVNGTIATQADKNDAQTQTVFQTPLSSIHATFAGNNQYLVTTKASGTEDGYAFLVHKSTGAFEQIAGPLKGLTALASPDGSEILVSYDDSNNGLHMELITTKTHSVTQLPLATIAADKCVWTADSSSAYCGVPQNPSHGIYPDDWYQGAVSFNDQIWQINAASRFARLVLDFSKEEQGKKLDAVSLAINPTGTVLSFVNRVDGSLWAYKLQ